MRLLAEGLLELGRLPVMFALLSAAHGLIIWRWFDSRARLVAGMAWWGVFLLGTMAYLALVHEPAITGGIDYLRWHMAHAWLDDGEALNHVLLRWWRVNLPFYAVWWGAWGLGLLGLSRLVPGTPAPMDAASNPS